MMFRLLSPLIPLDDFFCGQENSPDQFAHTDARKRIEAIYAVLTVLDKKASALMRLDGVMLAAALFGIDKLYGVKSGWFGIIALSSLISMIFCLAVIDWKFLGHVTRDHAGAYNFESEIISLRKLRSWREWCYWMAWSLAVLASLTFLVVLLRALFQ